MGKPPKPTHPRDQEPRKPHSDGIRHRAAHAGIDLVKDQCGQIDGLGHQ